MPRALSMEERIRREQARAARAVKALTRSLPPGFRSTSPAANNVISRATTAHLVAGSALVKRAEEGIAQAERIAPITPAHRIALSRGYEAFGRRPFVIVTLGEAYRAVLAEEWDDLRTGSLQAWRVVQEIPAS